MPQEDKVDLIYAFYQGVCRHLQTVVPITTGANKQIDFEAWLDAVDTRCEVHQLRNYLLTNDVRAEVLKAVLQHHLDATARASSDDKLDLLLVHYLAQSISRCDTDIAFAEQLAIPVSWQVLRR